MEGVCAGTWIFSSAFDGLRIAVLGHVSTALDTFIPHFFLDNALFCARVHVCVEKYF